MTKHAVLAAVAVGTLGVACVGSDPAPRTPEPQYIRLFVQKDGQLELNGQQATLAEVTKALEAAPQDGSTAVLYAREAPQEDPHPNGMKVMEIVVGKRLPVRFSSRRDFSDVIGRNGQTR